MALSWVLILLAIAGSGYSRVVLNENAFDGFLMHVDEKYKEDDLKFLFSSEFKTYIHEASKVLYVATKGRAYLRDFQILVPKNWSRKSIYETAGQHSRDLSDVWLADENAAHGDAPYTVQPGDCGEQGKFIHVTPAFVKETTTGTKQNIVVAAKTLVQNFVKYRYGVFDENAPYAHSHEEAQQADYRPFYYKQDGDKVLTVTSCGLVSGKQLHTDGTRCDFSQGNVDHQCRFYADEKQSINSSLMFTSELADIVEFCDEEGPNAHVPAAPNEHNTRCEYRSVWSVLREHSDFQGFQASQKVDASQVPEPKIRFFHPAPMRRLVYVIDMSRSMEDPPCKLETVIKALEATIAGLELPIEVGMVQFNNYPKTLVKMTKLETPRDLKEFADNVPKKPDGATCIECGVNAALTLLRGTKKTGFKDPKGSLMILISDGEETDKHVLDKLPELIAAGVIVNTLAIGPEASSKLTTLSTMTGGRAFSQQSVCKSVNRLVGQASQASGGPSSTSTSVIIPTQPGSTTTSSIHVDKGIVMNLVIKIAWDTENKGISILVRMPSGKEFTVEETPEEHDGWIVYPEKSLVGLTVTKGHGLVILRFTGVTEVGLWQIIMTKVAGSDESDKSEGSCSCVGVPSPEEHTVGIKLNVWPSRDVVNLTRHNHVMFFASLLCDASPILDAIVELKVERENVLSTLEMRDDGRGPDSTANDGTYTAIFSAFEVSKNETKYGLRVLAHDGPSSRIRTKGSTIKTGVFWREGYSSFKTLPCVIPPPQSPPGTIKHFEVVSSPHLPSNQVLFQWPEPFSAKGSALTHYEAVISDKMADVIPAVSKSLPLIKVEKLGRYLPTNRFFTREMWTYTRGLSGVLHARIRAVNEHGMVGNWSNMASTDWVKPPVDEPPPNPNVTEPTATTSTTTKATTSGSTYGKPTTTTRDGFGSTTSKISTRIPRPDSTTPTVWTPKPTTSEETTTTEEEIDTTTLFTTPTTTTTTDWTTTESTPDTTTPVKNPSTSTERSTYPTPEFTTTQRPGVENCPGPVPRLPNIPPALLDNAIIQNGKVVFEIPLMQYLQAACRGETCHILPKKHIPVEEF